MRFEQVKFPSVHEFGPEHLCQIDAAEIDNEIRSLKEQYIVKLYRSEDAELWDASKEQRVYSLRSVYSFGNTNIFMDTLPYIEDGEHTKYHIKFFKGIPDLRAPFQSISADEAFETLFDKKIPAYHMLDIIDSLRGS